MKATIDGLFGSRILGKEMFCAVQYYPTGEFTVDGKPKQESRAVCKGPLKEHKATITKFAHLAVFDQGEASRQPSNDGYRTCGGSIIIVVAVVTS